MILAASESLTPTSNQGVGIAFLRNRLTPIIFKLNRHTIRRECGGMSTVAVGVGRQACKLKLLRVKA